MGTALETPFRIEPCFFETDIPRVLADLATGVHSAAAELGKALHPGSAAELSERTARKVVSKLVEEGFLKSDTPKSAVWVAFPLDYRDRLFPNLFADHWIGAPEPPTVGFGKK